MVGNYRVITLCGSTRFKEAFIEAQKRLTLEGNIVISVGLFGHSGDDEVWEGMDEDTLTKTKVMLDDMHKRKIDMADEIYVINVDGYIGESTKSEIIYAKKHGKQIRYLLEDENTASDYGLLRVIDISILPITVRLCHVLNRNGIYYLHEVENYSKSELFKMRNMGATTLEELEQVCKEHGIHIHSSADLNDDELGITLTEEQYQQVFDNGIRTKTDLINTADYVLAEKFGAKRELYKKLYHIKVKEKQRAEQNL